MPRQGQKRRAAPVDFVAEILCGRDGNEEGDAGKHDGPVGAAGTPPAESEYKSKNLETERRRRARIKHQLFTLRSLVPRITKAYASHIMSKEATITDAVDYIQELERQKERLQKELLGMADETPEKQVSDSRMGAEAASQEPVHCKAQEGVEMSTLGKNRFLAGIVCRSRRGGFTRMVEAVGSLGLEVTDASFLSVDGLSQIMLCMEVSKALVPCGLSVPGFWSSVSTAMKSRRLMGGFVHVFLFCKRVRLGRRRGGTGRSLATR
ncbi:hypothetical protein Taro_030414 [Colocasia esculenta]|uniref:BHLH domain-containing protein n=1 Tax=Colocasia esculenta TaxID=4460 RepID=A0A843W065_COLES|nr:hypothetical protein [Colocasia esculenta]